MSESEYEEVTVSSDGVTVIKTFEADAFPVPAIAFRIRSERSGPVTVTLVDQVPEEVAVEDLGFHPEYGADHWTIEDDEITFEREIEPGSEYTTVYGIRATGTDNVEQFLTEPSIADVDPPLEDEDSVISSGGSDVVRDVISGDTDSVPGLDDDAGEDEEDVETLDLKDPNEPNQPDEPEEAEAEDEEADDEEEEAEATEDDADEEETEEPAEAEADDSAQTTAATDGAAAVAGGSVAATLAEEIREGRVDDDDLAVIEEEMDLGATDGATDARIQQLQSEVSDLEAYTSALEEFLNENGTAQQVLEDVQSDIETVQNTLESVQESVESHDQELDDLDDDVSEASGKVDEVVDEVKSVKSTVDDLESQLDEIDDVSDEVSDLADDVDDIEDEIDELQDWREQLSSVLGAGE
jgi:peptidoglycan hydrolase CwlO-like protein